ncbi:MAG: hypothetical protein RL662_1690 [Bacteroidota bacterium]|jgi:F0F1-type ATP synthase epsilon subunit
MKIVNIISDRKRASWVSYQLIFEWEDKLSELLDVPVIHNKINKINFKRHLLYTLKEKAQFVTYSILGKKSKSFSLYFQLLVHTNVLIPMHKRKETIPVIVDGFIEEKALPEFYKKFRGFPIVLISSIETYNLLKTKNCPLNIGYWGLSLSDDYKLDKNILYPKSFDVVLIGRQNHILQEFLEKYILENPEKEVEVITADHSNPERLACMSSKTGEIGVINDRASYMDILKQCKIALYATPDIDGDEKSRMRTKGFNPVTPKYLELLASQTKILARYPDTIETRLYELDKVSPHIETYEHFEEIMNDSLKDKPVDLNLYSSILAKHYTSVRAEELTKIVENLN